MNAKRVTDFKVGDLYSRQMEGRTKWLMVVRVMADMEIVCVIIWDPYHHGSPRYEAFDMKQLGRALKNFELAGTSEMPTNFTLRVNNFRANGHRRPPMINTPERAIAALVADEVYQ